MCGDSEMISRVVESKGLPNAAAGFALTFSDQSLPYFDVELHWLRRDETQVLPGNWYRGVVAGEPMKRWLCPALGLYFTAAPRRLFVRADPLPPGIDPIWHVDPNDPRPRRFVSARG